MRALTDSDKQRILDLLIDLVAIDSATTSTEQDNRDRVEERMAAYLSDYLKRLGMTVEKQEVFPGRPNLMAHWSGQGDQRSLMLEAHMDTVTVEGMTVDPFNATLRDGRIYGRGTCDTKGSMAAFLSALTMVREADQLPADKIYFVATMSEEDACTGAEALMGYGFRTDAAIVGEATGCRVVTAHKGPVWLEVKTKGQSCHASVPQQGRNAIDLMARIIRFIHGPWSKHIQQSQHALLGRSTAAVTCIHGGAKTNIIPAECSVDVDCRFIPGQPFDEIIADFKRMLAKELSGEDRFEIEVLTSQSPLNTPTDAPLVQQLLDICRATNGQEDVLGVNYFADTGPFTQAGITSVLFGPGDIAQAHTADEYLELDQLFQASEIMLELLTRNAGRSIVESG